MKSGELVALQINGSVPIIYYAFKEKITDYTPKRSSKKMHILSPFDNLVILRKRVQNLFDFSYLLECYVTPKKRKVGYFSLPLLFGKDFVGQVDLKADRKTKILWIRNLVWENNLKNSATVYPAFIKKLQSFAAFNGCEEIQSEVKDKVLLDLLKGDLKSPHLVQKSKMP